MFARPSAALKVSCAYHAYSTEFDTVTDADRICAPIELARHRRKLDDHLQGRARPVIRRVHCLQRSLQAKQMRLWQFDCEDGLLDAARLTRVIVDPLSPLCFKREGEALVTDTAVTLLVDNSGSMRGLPILTAAACAEAIGAALERCGVSVEVLGFTTHVYAPGGRGGGARQRWLAEGRPSEPGRLADLHHIVYKPADVPSRRTRLRLAAMLDDGLPGENVDGEALIWAYDRLLCRRQSRRILMILCDGAPLEEATLAANDAGYLERHLRCVIDWIERRGSVELIAIGVGHDVTAWYSRAMRVSSADELGEAMVGELIRLLNRSAHAMTRMK